MTIYENVQRSTVTKVCEAGAPESTASLFLVILL